ncbi:MarR family transcriptional regulator [Rhodococcus sp. IEGM 1366]|uniref:MarR family winged helix-turn-helix transcriptional regulator n=1 Tax=Rhodococcus sp. IEGM 1366 TaxID=3082223 RepID=UPI002953F8EF|nr:MarR family transcriptional regulator [Rhodococcus sp. IEGM 1366]MDV8068319.1 MarR family transcriptional regulator [Rhodococcus sp. IEGM 1366]
MDERADRLREDVALFSRRIRTKSSGHLLTPTQLQALAHLDRVGAMSARALADLERVVPQTIARTVLLLEEKGMVTRTVDPHDARASLISITDIGRRTLDVDRAARSEWLTSVLTEEFTDVERELLYLAGRLLRRAAESTDTTSAQESVMRA